jgi:hypothetical protein
LGYFDYFKYPLNKAQILLFSTIQINSDNELNEALLQLVSNKKIEYKNGYYSLSDIDDYLSKRLEGESRFKELEDRVNKSCKRLSNFPFVRFVGLSGSLSKGYAPPNADIDLFIITQKNRLWICRTLLHLMKKISFLKGSQHWYCMNYFIDETALQIEEQNFFTATELATLKPRVDTAQFYDTFLTHNMGWMNNQLPNYIKPDRTPTLTTKLKWWGKVIEALSSDGLNKGLMVLTDRKWRNKWKRKNFPQQDYELAFKTRINISKNHFHNYQKKMLQHLDKVNEIHT